MRKKVIYGLGIYILLAHIFLTDALFCSASEIGSGAYPVENRTQTEQPPASAITAVSVSPGTTVVSKSASYAFVASVAGQNNYSQEVAWSIQGQTSQNTFIDGSGILHVGADETSSSLIVKAVSKQDSNYSATALVTVQTASYSIQVKASPDNGGTVHGGGTVKEGGYAVITATPNSGFTFTGWLLNNNKVSDTSQYTIENVHSDGVYIAEFKPSDCQIQVSVNDSNAGTATEGRTVKYGESMTLDAAAKDGYHFDGWMENGTTISTDSRLQLNHITGSRNLTAMFSRNKYDLSLYCWPASTGTVSGQGTYEQGSNVKIAAAPASGYRFVSWSENGNVVSSDQEYEGNNITKDMFFLATFEEVQTKTYSITASVSSPNGKIVPEGKSSVLEGSGISYVIIPQEDYDISAVYVDGKSVGAVSSYGFSDVKENHTISADFTRKPAAGGENQAAEQEADQGDEADDGTAQDESGEDAQKNEAQELTGTLKHLAVSVEDAERMIEAGEDTELMAGALEAGDLKLTVHNDFVKIDKESSSVTDLAVAAGSLLTKEEKIELLQGNVSAVIHLSIDDIDGEETQLTQKAFAEGKQPDMTVGRYFEISLTKAVQRDVQTISQLPKKLQIVIDVPKHLQADNREFYILRLHTNKSGLQDFAQLSDEDDNPGTITFSTDRFSPYAIAYIDRGTAKPETAEDGEGSVKESGMANVVGIMAVAIAVVTTCALVWCIVRRKRR